MTPNNIHGCDLHDGQFGKQGTIVNWIYTYDGEKRVAKQIIEEIDDVNNSITFKMMEGDLLKDYKKFRATVKATPKGEGSVVHWTFEYEKKKPQTPHPNTLLDVGIAVTKDIDAHLQTS